MRWVVLAASVVLQTCLGAIYAWSAFVPSLKGAHGITGGQAGLIFGVAIAVFTTAAVFAGRMMERRGPRLVASIGAVVFGSGYLAASYTGGSFGWLLVSLGLLVGLGTGFGYVCPLATCVRWFPRHKGLITGVAVAGFGGGAILLSGLAGHWLSGGMPVLEAFRLVGSIYGTAALAAALLLRVPQAAGASLQSLMPVRVLLASREFRALAVGMFAGTFGGLLVVGNLGPMGLAAGLPSKSAILAVQVFAAGNAAGRIGWGWLYDRFGRIVLPVSLLAILAAILALSAAETSSWFLALAAAAGFCFGACFVVYAAQTAGAFGAARLAGVYPIIFLAYGFAGLTGPSIGGAVADRTGSFDGAVALACVILALGALAVWRAGRGGAPDETAPLRLQEAQAAERA